MRFIVRTLQKAYSNVLTNTLAFGVLCFLPPPDVLDTTVLCLCLCCAGMLQIMSDLMHAGVRLWDNVYRHGSNNSLLDSIASAADGSSRVWHEERQQYHQKQHAQQQGTRHAQGSVHDADMF